MPRVAVILAAAFTLLSQDRLLSPLRPAGSIELALNDGSSLIEMVGTTSTLCALLRSKTGSEIVRFDLRGGVLDRTAVHRQTQSFAVDADGTVTALRRRAHESIVSNSRFGSTLPSPEKEVAGPLERVTTWGGKTVGVAAASIRTGIGFSQTMTIPATAMFSYRTAPLPDGSLAIIDSQNPTLWKLDPGGSFSAPVALVAPELEHFPPSATNLAIYDAVALPNGDLMLAASPYKPAEGVRLMRFDANGNFKSALRVLMPEFPELAGIAGGRLGVSKMAFVGDRLFIGSSTSVALRIVYLDLGSR
jgi:hypothetical protein